MTLVSRYRSINWKALVSGLSSELSLEGVQGLATAIEGGLVYPKTSPEWLGLQALFWATMDRLVSEVDESDIDTLFDRLAVTGFAVSETGFLPGEVPQDISRSVTPYLFERMG